MEREKVAYTIVGNANLVVTIKIDEEVGGVVRQREFCGFGLKDAIRQANKRLNVFGYEIA